MLRKLLKHEFRATGRIMGPLYLVLLVTAVGANFSTRGLLEGDGWFLDMLGGLLVIAFTVAIMGVCLMSLVLMVQRFYRNLLGDEGYVMMTLPVSIHQQIWSKLIVSAVWFAATFLAVCLAGGIMVYDVDFMKQFLKGLGELIQHITGYYAINGAALAAELILLAFLSCCAMCLLFYAAMAAGHSFANRKSLLSVAFFFGFQFALQIISATVVNLLDKIGVFDLLPDWQLEGLAGMHIAIWIGIAAVVLYGAVFYFITAYCLKRHLNLE
ncbi:hypothetical protein [Oscillibacter sp.]|uniref:hypothetical protein n=1 Tax=Oscillibacter sp. TaxID=1945593 RepID=UPI00260E74B5|nr:hypothetical protein [Oscillibacter sp.]MDD3347959.1 hypothetical protein [Oscillibacter sp.]